QTPIKQADKKVEAPAASSTSSSSSSPVSARRAVGKFEPGTVPAVLLQKRDGTDGWQRLVRDNPVFTNDYLVSLPGYRSEIRLDNGVRLVLWGDLPDGTSPFVVLESGAVLHASPEFDLDFTLDRGRIIFSNHKSDGQARIRLRFHQETWDVTLLET